VTSSRSRPRLAAFAGLTALFIGAALWKPADDGLPLCAFKLWTGRSCPGCGMTRALAALGRGDAAASVTYHAFAPIVAAAAVFAWGALGIGLLTGRNLLPDFNTRAFQVVCLAFIAAFVVYWLFRLWRGTAP
jgi:hypothetical protein